MSKYQFFCAALILISSAFGHVPNGDFEQWSGNSEPIGWWTNNFGTMLITQSADAHGGASSAKGEVKMVNTTMLQPLLISGLIGGHGFPVAEKYANLTGYYKLFPVNGENLSIVVAPFKNGQVIGSGGFQFFQASDYTQFIVPIFYPTNSGTPDSMQISVTIGNNSAPVNLGAYFIIDDLSFQGIATDIEDKNNSNPNEFSLEQNYPNPFNPATTISYAIGSTQFVTLKIYDVLGNEVALLVNELKSPGKYSVEFNADGLSSGIYFYRISIYSDQLKSGGSIQTKKMIIMK